MSSYQKLLPELIGDMSGRDTLSGWDVLVSYQEDKINGMLASRAQRLKITETKTFQAPYQDPFTGDDSIVDVTMDMQSPRLQFEDGDNGLVSFVCGLTGSYHLHDPTATAKTIEFPKGLTLTIKATVATVIGEWQDNDIIPGSGPVRGPSYVVKSPEDGHTMHAVVIDFTKLLSVDVTSDSPDIQPGSVLGTKLLIQGWITDYFGKIGLKYYIAGLSNSYETRPEAGVQVLKPVSFCFTVTPPNSTASPPIPAALCIWIGVKGGTNDGKHPEGPGLLAFAPNGFALTPIPVGNDCSIIFSSHVISSLFLTPALAQHLENVNPAQNPPSPKGGLVTNFNFRHVNINVQGQEARSHDHYDSWANFNGCNFGNDSPAAIMEFCHDLATVEAPPVSISYSTSQNINYQYGWTSEDGDGRDFPVRKSDSLWANFKLNGRGQWLPSSDPVKAPNQLGLGLSFDQSFQVSTNNDDFLHGWFGGGYPDSLNNLNPQTPDFRAEIFLDYFLTTNLIFPGEYIFKADPPVAEHAGASHGLATPRDTILTAQLNVDSKVAAVRRGNLMLANSHMRKVRASTEPKTVDGLFAELRVQPPKPILGDFVVALASADADAGEKCLALLKSYGYGELTADDFMHVVQQTSDSAWAQLQNAGKKTISSYRSETSANMTPADIRYYSGKYIIRSPDSLRGTVMKVDARTGEITYKGATDLPSKSFDDTTGLTSFTFSRGDRQFSISFQAFFAPLVLLFTSTVKGNVIIQGEQVEFTGELSETAPHDDLKHVFQKDLQFNDPAPIDIVGYIGFGISVIGNIVAYIWRRQDRKPAQELNDSIKANNKNMDKGYNLLKNGIKELAKDQVATEMVQKSADIARLKAEFDAKLQADIVRELGKVNEADVLAFGAGGDLSSPTWESVMDAADGAVTTQVNSTVEQIADVRLRTTLQPYQDAHYIDIEASDTIRDEASHNAARSWKDRFDKPRPGGSRSYIEAAVATSILKKKVDIQTQQIGDKQSNLEWAKMTFQNTTDEIEKRKKDLREKKDKANDPELSEKEREEAEKEAKQLEEDIETKEKEAEQKSKEMEQTQGEIDRQRDEQTETERERAENEREAGAGRDHAFEGV